MSFSISTVTMNEGQAGSTADFAFVLTDLNYQDGDTVYFQTRDGSATVADGDYRATSGFLTFSDNTTAMTIDALVVGDNLYEPNENFYLDVYQQPQTTTATTTATATTILSSTSVVVTTRTSTATTTLTSTAATTTTLTSTAIITSTFLTTSTIVAVSFLPTPATTGTQVMISSIPATATFVSSQTLAPTLTLPVYPSIGTIFGAMQFAKSTAVVELDRSVTAADDAAPSSGYTVLVAQGTAIIKNDDPAPAFSISNAGPVNEGDQLVFAVTRSNDAQATEIVLAQTSDGTATRGRDYTGTATALTFTQGQLTQTFVVQTNRDGLYNGMTAETVVASLSLVTNDGATIAPGGGTATGGINDRDPAPSLALSPPSLSHPEGNSGETDYVYTVTRTEDAERAQTVSYGVAGSGTNQADANDFVGGQLPSGTLTFTTGQSAQTITVRVAGDTVYEPDETFTLSLGTPNFGAVTAGAGAASGTILSDETATISGLANSTSNLQDPAKPFASATVRDSVDGATDSLTIAPSGAAGTLAGAGLTTNGDGLYTLAFASPQTLSNRLDALTFTPAIANDGPLEATTFGLKLTSSTGATGAGSVSYTVDSRPNQNRFGTTTTSASSPQGEVYALYQGLLGRNPDQVGAEQWVADLQGGVPLDQVTAGFLNSKEGSATFTPGSTDAAFVDQLYARVLGRMGDPRGEAYWNQQLAAGESRADVADGFVFSQEHLGDIQPALNAGVFIADDATSETARLYYGLLGRTPDGQGLQSNTAQLDANGSLTALAQSFLDSAEYKADNPTPPSDAAFVNALYQNALGRAPESAGLANYEAELASGTSRAKVATEITQSDEAQRHLAGRIENGFHLS